MGWRKSISNLRFLRAAALLALGSGCYNYRVAAPHVSPSTDPEPPRETQWAFLWGAIEPTFDTKCYCMNNALQQSTVSTNYAFALLTVLSLGTVVPLQVEVVCAKPPPGSPSPTPPDGCPNVVKLPPGAVPPEADDADGTAPEEGETDGDSF